MYLRFNKKPGAQYFMSVGSKKYEFYGGKISNVPDDVAEICLSKTDNNGLPLFVEMTGIYDSDIQQALGIQLEWPIFGKKNVGLDSFESLDDQIIVDNLVSLSTVDNLEILDTLDTLDDLDNQEKSVKDQKSDQYINVDDE